jgi:carbamoyltransferase
MEQKMIIGLTIGHDASVSISDSGGNILFAAGEERFSRVKGHMGAPYKALEAGINYLNLDRKELSKIPHVVAGAINLASVEWFYFLLLSKSYQAKFDIFNGALPPGLLQEISSKMNMMNGSTEEKFKTLLEQGLEYKIDKLVSINHHDAHAACAFWASNFKESLVLTLDGSGDGESGTLRVLKNSGEQKILKRIPDKYSLGHLYSEVTKRYGFKESRHEGKITGLAAFSTTDPNLIKFDNLFKKNFYCGFSPKYRLDFRFRNPKNLKSFDQRLAMRRAVERSERKCLEFPDLASSIQNYLEKSVLELIGQYKTSKHLKISLAGGVFSNVLLNGSIREEFPNDEVYVFPNMGDGGLSSGAIWEYLRLNGMPFTSNVEHTMYLGTDLELIPKNWVSIEKTPKVLAQEILDRKIIGIMSGRMEFGPRALCHRSIVASPTDSSINHDLNLRLSRTEFMPFAPIVRDVDFDKVFCDSNQKSIMNRRNFNFMTETCFVRQEYRNKIQAVVHQDGTARPQLLTRHDNEFLYETMSVLSQDHDLPAIINTSFNAHEEPIIENIYQAKQALDIKRIDKLYLNNHEVF